MQAIETIMFFLEQENSDPLERSVSVSGYSDCEEAADGRRPAVFVIPWDASDTVKSPVFGQPVTDAGTKPRGYARPLALYLCGCGGPSLVRFDATSPGRLRRSLSALLGRAEPNGIYFVAVGSDCDALWTERVEPVDYSRPFLAGVEPDPGLAKKYRGRAPAKILVRKLVAAVAPTEAPVLIMGETGTGKELVAHAVHDGSPRRGGPWSTLNCGSIVDTLFESELFGHEKGAATGLTSQREGLMEHASTGTLFLDEIGEMSMPHQAKLLRALEDGEIRRVGSDESRKVNPRIVAATNRDLVERIRENRFREDLYYRLAVFTIRTPPLRESPRDIKIIAEALWHDEIGGARAPLTDPVLDYLAAQKWPGNVRELRHLLLRLKVYLDAESIRVATVEYLERVRDLHSGGLFAAARTPTGGEMKRHRAQCLAHLSKTDEVVRKCEVSLRPVLRGKGSDERAALIVISTLEWPLRELESLGMHPYRFHTSDAYGAANRLNAELGQFVELLREDVGGARQFWESTLRRQFKRTQKAISAEIRALEVL